jgi:peptidyl-dipeptidase Dcp
VFICIFVKEPVVHYLKIKHAMKQLYLIIILAISMNSLATETNPFFSPYTNQYGIPPFEEIKIKHYLPAFYEGIKTQQTEVEKITSDISNPTFENTIEPLEFSGEVLKKVSSVFFNLYAADTNEDMEKIANEISPLLTEQNDNIYLNEKLFKRIKSIHNQPNNDLSLEQKRLLEKYYKTFVRGGADLTDNNKARIRQINKELTQLELNFGQNVLDETNSYKKVIENEKELAGLPVGVKQAAAESAKKIGLEGKWLFTTHKASFIPVLQYCDNRNLRKELLLAYSQRANQNNDKDNKAIVTKIIKLRLEKANILGFRCSADYSLDETMAKSHETVYNFLTSIWEPALSKAKIEANILQKLMNDDGINEKIEAWDWWYYSEKLRNAEYQLNEEAIKPYFKLENVRQGAFDLASKLYGLKFKEIHNMPIYHPEVEVFEVSNADGSLIGVLYTDYFPRAGKHAGAWMNNITDQYIKNGINHRPIILNIGNFTRPTSDHPSLLNMDEVRTLFHEFGHALHGLLSQCTYPSLSGTNVLRDFVELPSQVMENWCFEPEVLKTYARHYQTSQSLPSDLIDKIKQTQTFNQGFTLTEILSAAILDMDLHTITDTSNFDITNFEKKSLDRMGLIPEIIVRYRSTYFSHIFGGGYNSGYYSYTWAEVLDADVFQLFKESGDLYNQKIATDFRYKILEKGDKEDPMKLYLDFRGSYPKPDALLKSRGLK